MDRAVPGPAPAPCGRQLAAGRRLLRTAARIAIPAAVERVTLSAAQIAATRIVSPLGTIAVAANSLAVTAESLCYMPGYGISAAATTLVGQSLGAGHKGRARRFAWLSTALGMAVMGLTAVLMYAGAPWLFRILTPDATVRALGVQVLRIEAFAEPLFAASIVAAGALRGAGDTLVPSVLNLVQHVGRAHHAGGGAGPAVRFARRVVRHVL